MSMREDFELASLPDIASRRAQSGTSPLAHPRMLCGRCSR